MILMLPICEALLMDSRRVTTVEIVVFVAQADPSLHSQFAVLAGALEKIAPDIMTKKALQVQSRAKHRRSSAQHSTKRARTNTHARTHIFTQMRSHRHMRELKHTHKRTRIHIDTHPHAHRCCHIRCERLCTT